VAQENTCVSSGLMISTYLVPSPLWSRMLRPNDHEMLAKTTSTNNRYGLKDFLSKRTVITTRRITQTYAKNRDVVQGKSSQRTGSVVCIATWLRSEGSGVRIPSKSICFVFSKLALELTEPPIRGFSLGS